MKTKLLLMTLLALLLISCKKTSTAAQGQTIKFEVTLSSGVWDGQYSDTHGDIQAVNLPASWNYTYINESTAAYISVIPTTNTNVTITINLYVNNVKVRTSTITTDGHTVMSQMLYTF